jgi:hypothetical protein
MPYDLSDFYKIAGSVKYQDDMARDRDDILPAVVKFGMADLCRVTVGGADIGIDRSRKALQAYK